MYMYTVSKFRNLSLSIVNVLILMHHLSLSSYRYDVLSEHVFIGTALGEIILLRITQAGFSKTSVLKVHSSAIRSLEWDSDRQMLYSASNDHMVICWDVGEKKGKKKCLRNLFVFLNLN